MVVSAWGLTEDAQKKALGFVVEATTEAAGPIKGWFRNLIERGLGFADGLLLRPLRRRRQGPDARRSETCLANGQPVRNESNLRRHWNDRRGSHYIQCVASSFGQR